MKTKHIPVISALFLIIAMTIQFVVSYQWEKKRVLEHIDYEMRLAQKDFIFEIYDIQDAGEEMQEYIQRHFDKPDRIQRQTWITLRRFPDVMACYVSFRPGFYHKDDYWYCPCAWWRGDSIMEELYGDEQHDYFKSDWYNGAIKSEKGTYWSPGYRDEDFEEPICTHSVRVEKDGELACVVGLDFSLDWVDRMLEDIKPFDDAYCMLFSSDGTLMLTSDNIQPNADSKNVIQIVKDDWIIQSMTLSPVDMRIEIGVPKSHVLKSVRQKSLITLVVLLLGILVAGLLIRQIRRDQAAFTRVETENKVMEREIHIASRIQKGILKENGKRIEQDNHDEVEVLADLVPMKEVGGDLYDYFRKGEDLFFIIGDVSGKGVSAAMFMSATVNLFRSAVRRLQSPKAIMEEINSVLSDNNPSMMFVTAFIGKLNVPTGELLYCNAGHLSPIKVESGKRKAESLNLVPNIPIGYEESFKYEEQGTILGEDEMIVLYTDGITESRNEQRDMLGMKRWMEIIESCKQSVISEQTPINQMLLSHVKAFAGKAEQVDDVTLMVIRKTSAQKPLVIRVENRMDRWPVLRSALHEYGLCAGMEARALKKTEVAIEEAVVNIVKYSQAEWMELKMKNEKLKINITISDNGVAFDPTKQKEVDIERVTEERQVGGLGISLLRKIADEVRYSREDEINTLTIIKQI